MALTQTQVSKLYVSIFNRASEGNGNTYWQTNGADLASVATEMLATPDAATYFGSSLNTNQAFVEHIYLNTLNKTVAQDAAGIAYWVAKLDAGTSRGQVVADLVTAVGDYATSTDPVTLAAYNQFHNRVVVSNYMADTVAAAPSDYATSTSFSSGLTVTSSASTVTTAQAAVDDIANPGQTFSLTTGTDTGTAFTGGSGNDTFNAAVLTANDGDILAGGEGSDVLNLETAASVTSNFKTSSIETINLNALGAISVDMTNKTGVTAFNSNDAAGAVTLNNIADTAATYGVKGAATNNLTLNYATAVLNGSADKLNVKLNGATNATVDADSGFESVELNVTAASTLTSLVAPSATALTISGNATLTTAATSIDSFTDYTVTNTAKVTYNDIATVKTFNASANTDGIVGKDLVGGTGLDATTTADKLTLSSTGSLVQTGSGADNINVDTSALFSSGSAIVKLGAGNDILNLSAVGSSGEFIYGEAGDDLIYVGAALGSNDLVDGGEGTDTVSFASGTTNTLIAKGIENVKVKSATGATTSVAFTAIDSAVAITDSGVGTTTFSNLKSGSTYTSTAAKEANTGDLTLGFATSSAATLNVDLTKGTSDSITLTQVADATVTLGAASTVATGLSLDSAATKLTVNATGAVNLTSILAGTSGDSTTAEKLATVAVTGSAAVTTGDIANDKSLSSLDVKSTSTTAGSGNVSVGAVNSDVAVTSINVSTAAGSAALGAIDAANTTNTAGITTLTVSGASATASSVTSITADKLTTLTISNTTGHSTVGAITATGSTTNYTDGAIGTITLTGKAGASATSTIAADNIGTVTVTSTGTAAGNTDKATIGNVTAAGDTASYTDGTITALKASAVGNASIGDIRADNIGSIIVESTSTTIASTATLGDIDSGSIAQGTLALAVTNNKATVGTIDVKSNSSSATIGAIDATQLGNTTVTGATTAQLGAIAVANATNTSTTGNIALTAGTGAATLAGALSFDTVGTISVKGTGITAEDITALNTSGLTVTLDATTGAISGAKTVSNVKGDLNVTLKGTTSAGIAATAGTASTVTDADISYDASAMTGVISSTTITNNSTDSASSITVKGGASTNTFVLTGATTGTVSYQGQNAVDNVTISQAVGSATINTESNDDVITLTTTGTMASTITINGGAGTDKLVLKDAGLVDVDLTNVTNVETLELSAASTVTLGAQAQEAGIVTVTGSTADDTINASAMTVGLTITGGTGADTITGGAGDDNISLGADVVVDTVIFAATAALNGTDTITQFTAAAGGDVLNFNALLGTGAALDADGTYSTGSTKSNVSISDKVIFADTNDYADTAALQAVIKDASDGTNWYLGNGEKAIILLGDVANGAQTFTAYLVTGATAATDTFVSIGTVGISDGDGMVAANLILG